MDAVFESCLSYTVRRGAPATGIDVPGDPGSLVSHQDREWAIDQLIAHADDASPYEDRDTDDQRGAARAAARSLPHAAVDPTFIDRRDSIFSALATSAHHPALETRRTLVTALNAIWDAPCTGSPCVHRRAYDVASALIEDVEKPDQFGAPGRSITTTAQLVRVDRARIDMAILLIAASAAVDAWRVDGGCGVAADATALSTALIDAVAVSAAAEGHDRHGFSLLGASALRHELAASPGLIDVITLKLIDTPEFIAWRSGLFAAALSIPPLRAHLATRWPPLVQGLISRLSTTPAPQQSDKWHLARVAALLPPTGSRVESNKEFLSLLDDWSNIAIGNNQAISQFAAWAVEAKVETSQILSTLNVVIPNRDAIPERITNTDTLFAYALQATRTEAEEASVLIWLDAFVHAGHDHLRGLTGDP